MDESTAASILTPHFDAVRDAYLEWRAPDGVKLSRLARVRLVVTTKAGGGRHYARTHTSGSHMEIAPTACDLPFDTLVAILAHEFGHAADFLYPGSFSWPVHRAGPSVWVGESAACRAAAWRQVFGKANARSRTADDDVAPAVHWMSAWEHRNDDQIEWAADGITELVTGRRVRYAGEQMLQSFGRGAARPAGLR